MDGKVCNDLKIPTKSNRVDIGVRVELPAVILQILQTNFMKVKSYIVQSSSRIMCVHSV